MLEILPIEAAFREGKSHNVTWLYRLVVTLLYMWRLNAENAHSHLWGWVAVRVNY